MDFSDADHADENTLNLAIWQSVKGPNVSMPTANTQVTVDLDH
jgi:hypothetical protein